MNSVECVRGNIGDVHSGVVSLSSVKSSTPTIFRVCGWLQLSEPKVNVAGKSTVSPSSVEVKETVTVPWGAVVHWKVVLLSIVPSVAEGVPIMVYVLVRLSSVTFAKNVPVCPSKTVSEEVRETCTVVVVSLSSTKSATPQR